MYEQNYRRGNFRSNVRSYQDFGRQNSRGEYRGKVRVGLEKDHFQGIAIIIEGMIEV